MFVTVPTRDKVLSCCDCLQRRSTLSFGLMAGILVAISSTAQASIILPVVPEFTLENAAKPVSSGDSLGSSSAPTEEPTRIPSEPQAELLDLTNAIPTGGASTGTSASGSGPSGPNTSALHRSPKQLNRQMRTRLQWLHEHSPNCE